VTPSVIVTSIVVSDAYTPEELAAIERAVAILKAHGDVDDPEARAAAERAEYEQGIREAAERAARDPEFQARAAASRRQEADARKRELEYRKAAARSDSRAAAAERLQQNPGVHAQRQCTECRAPVYDGKEPASGLTLCMSCWGRHGLTCDECGRKGDLTRWCSDHAWRCDQCVPGFLARPFEPKAGRIHFPTLAGSR
jgi:hypothetical protein